MVSQALASDVIHEMDHMPIELQRRVLDFAHALAGSFPKGTPGEEFAEFAGSFLPEDLEQMSIAIEEGCEKVDLNAW
ncbi:MAG: hypothetical protein RRC34_16930 [Lentisphaeria bacterium]|nr:hypothetical protein [Lentisphaeria bacterium]